MNGQSKKASMIEATANIAVGIGVAFAANMVVLPLYGYQVQAHEAAGMTGIFTAISFARSYALRRFFNRLHINSQVDKPMNVQRFSLEKLLRNVASYCRAPMPSMGQHFGDILDEVANDLKGVERGQTSLAVFVARYGLAANENQPEIEDDGFTTVEQ